ncbi:MAG: alpha/beta hydrolase domain-containing protein [Clostridia bacterium]
MRRLPPFAVLLAFLLASACAPAHAELTRLEITSKRSFGTFMPGEFVLWEGKVHGEISPQEPIPGLDRAPKNARGNVEYAARIVLIFPATPRRGNGTLLVDVPNRGNAYALALYNSPRDEPFSSGTFEQGTGFLQDRGFSVAEVYWEKGKGAELPTFTDAGVTRTVEGVGFAIMRDAARFLSRGVQDEAGTPNPLRGAIHRTLASGKSQSGRFLKTFLLHGFNVARGEPVFDAMHIFVASSGTLPILQASTGTESAANGIPTWENPEMRGVNEEPLAIADLVARVKARGEPLPRLMFVNSTTDFHALRASLGRTGASGSVEHPVPDGVRVYDIAGAPHVTLAKAPAGCELTQGRLDWSPVSRATLLRLNDWVESTTEPPASRLMPIKPADAAEALKAPAYLPNATIEVPRVDDDGNALGGVRLPDVAVPLGTHAALNRPTSRACMLIGAYKPFARTRAEREAAKDPRPSLEERYASRDDYVNRVRAAALSLEKDGFLLPEDAAVIVQEAASRQDLKKRAGAGAT